jgi:sulfonate transport system ATP-binding protein
MAKKTVEMDYKNRCKQMSMTLKKNNVLEIFVESMFYVKDNPILNNFNIKVCSGEILTLLGPSGVGKTTLLKIIAGIEKGYTGFVKLNESFYNEPGRDIQVLFQDNRIFSWLSVSQNIAFAMQNTKDKMHQNEDIMNLLHKVGLGDKYKSLPRELSGGELARVSVARALAGNASILLLDEPFSSIDVQLKKTLRQVLINYSRENNTTLILVTHNIDDALDISDRICVFSSKPISEYKQFSIDKSHPRNLSNTYFQNLAKELLTYLLSDY